VATSPSGLTNWAGNLRYRASRVHQPHTTEQVQELVRASRRLRPLGSRHSFNDIADTDGDLVTLADLQRLAEVDTQAATVTIDGGSTYGDLCPRLEASGLALPNLASLPHISVAGACATGTHGSGDRTGSLATGVAVIDVVTGDGELVTLRRGEQEHAGAVVSLGAMGIVVGLTLDLVPSFQVRQDVYERLPFAAAIDHFDEITHAADSVSLFMRWGQPWFDQVWLKRRTAAGSAIEPADDFLGAKRATAELHPIRELSADACTPQLGVVGPWHERLPHFRLDHTPSAGAELQSEYLVPREHAASALLALEAVRDRIGPLLMVSEIRTLAADELWLSAAYRRESVALHFTWVFDWNGVRDVLPVVESVLEPFEPRPHWGKLFTMPAEVVRARYPMLSSFVKLCERHDPRGIFRNEFLERTVFSDASS
jgi:xylitol oxidase